MNFDARVAGRARVEERLNDAQIGVVQADVFADERDAHMTVHAVNLVDQRAPLGHVRFTAVKVQLAAHHAAKALVLKQQRHLVERRRRCVLDDAVGLHVADLDLAVNSEIKPNPTIANVQDGVAAFKAAEADCIVTIGGGSSMDTAKAIGIIINNPEFADVRSLEGVAPTKKHAVFTIAVPTTAGTAAEVTINYVITDVEKKRKFVCVDTNDIPEIAVVDPDMMSSMPKGLTAATGMDALTHAIEGYITKGHCVISDMFHLEAIKLISQSLRGAVQNTPEGREGMALGQYIAGMGFSNVGLGIVHSMAHGLSALYDTPHGVACAILLPVGLEYNKSVAGERYRAVGKAMGVMGIDEMNDVEAADATIAAVKQLSADVGIPTNLNGILKEEDIQFLAESAYADACRPGNPRDTSVEEIVELYKSQL